MSASSDAPVESRVSILGGEVARRGVLALAPRSRLSRSVGLACLGSTILILLSSATLLAGLACVTVLGIGAWLVWPPEGCDQTRLDRWAVRRRQRARHARGADSYTRADELGTGSSGGWALPLAVGRVSPLDLSDTAAERLFVLHHTPTGDGQFLTVLLATDGLGAGLWTDLQHAATQAGFGAMLASLAKPGRWISDLGQLSRTLPQDLTEHAAFTAAQLREPPPNAPTAVVTGFQRLFASYDEVIEREAARCEEHRNWLVARFDLTDEFQLAAARTAPGATGWARLVRDELVQLSTRLQEAGLGGMEVLGEQRTVAALRSLQNPDAPPDRHGGLCWDDAFLSFTSSPTDLLVDGWWTRLACIPFRGIEAAQLGPRWLAPLLVDLSPAVARTVATRIRPVPASSARATAVKDATTDTSAKITADAEGKIDDGTDWVMLDASTRRLRDLAPGSGHVGIEWAMFIALQARTEDELEDACRAVSEAAADSSIIELDWLTYEQDLAWPAVLGLGRGMCR